MSSIAGKGYLVRRFQEAPTVRSECGQSTRPLTFPDTTVCNLHVTFIADFGRRTHSHPRQQPVALHEADSLPAAILLRLVPQPPDIVEALYFQ